MSTRDDTHTCRCLRSKGMHLPDQDWEAAGVPGPGSDYYWCTRTLRVLGPDDKLVAPDTCTPGRSCYRPS